MHITSNAILVRISIPDRCDTIFPPCCKSCAAGTEKAHVFNKVIERRQDRSPILLHRWRRRNWTGMTSYDRRDSRVLGTP